jgi:hypothetical protein
VLFSPSFLPIYTYQFFPFKKIRGAGGAIYKNFSMRLKTMIDNSPPLENEQGGQGGQKFYFLLLTAWKQCR